MRAPSEVRDAQIEEILTLATETIGLTAPGGGGADER
jgi:hypothetical protein